VIEFLKEAQIDNRGAWVLNTGQLLSMPLILAGVYFMLKANKRIKS